MANLFNVMVIFGIAKSSDDDDDQVDTDRV